MTTEARRRLYKPRAIVSLCAWAPSEVVNDYRTVPSGTQGVVRSVDDAGTIHVAWSNGASLGVTLEDEVIRIS
jgi:hypothetical protein